MHYVRILVLNCVFLCYANIFNNVMLIYSSGI